MTDTTYIKALREQWEKLHERLDLDIFITAVLTALEAERQRAERGEAAAGIIQQMYNELKGEQVPVGFAVMDENHDWHIDFCGKEHALSQGDSLFTALQNPVVLPKIRDSKYWGGVEFRCDKYQLDVQAAIEAAGGKVAK